MDLKAVKYSEYEKNVPQTGQHILAQQTADDIIVYQAYSKTIAAYAVKHQRFGGDSFSFNRMTWIKPNFLWMMYRCGWATKENQDCVLAIKISKVFFDEILSKAAYSSFKENIYADREEWETALNNSEVRLQWDPDHNPFGSKQERKAIQLGLKGRIMQQFAEKEIIELADITDFVKEQYAVLQTKGIDELIVPAENVYIPADDLLCKKLGLE
jgi:hypothetical protein